MALDRLAWFAVAVPLAGGAGCSSGSESSVTSDGAAPDELLDGGEADVVAVAPTYAPTFTALYDEIFSPSCAGVFCHGQTDEFLLMTSKDVAYKAMVGVASHGPACGDAGLTIVKPGAPDASLLYLKVTTPPCGNKMPAEDEPYLDSRQTGQVRQWILNGALDD
jgi:hypothetical protein